MKLRKILIRYVKSWLLIDFLSIVPIGQHLLASTGTARWLRMLQLFKTFRVTRMRHVMRGWALMHGTFGAALRVATILCIWLLIAHWAASGWCVRHKSLRTRSSDADVRRTRGVTPRGRPCRRAGARWHPLLRGQLLRG